MDTLRRVSAFFFYLLGIAVIVLILLSRRGMFRYAAGLNILDLPLLFAGMLFGGSSLYVSLAHEKKSAALLIFIFLPLTVLFGFFAYLNFAMPFAED
ncbi:hypothetical protein A3A67_02700 [Candidatus Peribacteria bacterium RIFCSPLOWO2_01_FULL_51_18]|nr:MAG: hypothetical protein A3C52_03545 [Candidatus Peribacteria bacterium RIFCSPHIGHO2_02_FULL_51_15]OGJ66920.1 MAG: hypothetical protein A3A67_02700 [Candidatus Peribacteria bacterium RIFCSPLOWO2_01_FULL_51_18]OGJ67674.1 MAG: hypothetical protein A3J34_01075 [Candidatus Peribacteria bacterium RIFCSPLOWO2_02_FULL_51_10]